MKLRTLDLFSGIGGFSLGLERTGGFETVAFCEIEPFPRRVLAKHWPEVPCYDDVRTVGAGQLAGQAIDVITAGFPCVEVSPVSVRRAGLEGTKSGLWSEVARLVGELRPRFLLVENSASLVIRGIDRVLSDLVRVGYDAEWHGLPAAAVGARHLRARTWLLAYPAGFGDRLPEGQVLTGRHIAEHRSRWNSEPRVDRVADGVPDRAHRLKALGNAVVPDIPELFGYAILGSLPLAGCTNDLLGAGRR